MRKNARLVRPKTHECAPASRATAEQELRRSVLACLLWEDSFYESGESIADRILKLVPKVDPIQVGLIAQEARTRFKLRHAPLWIVVGMLRAGGLYRQYAGPVIEEVIQRPDELSELLALYWKDGRIPLANQLKKGLRRAFRKFNAYQLAKYDRSGEVRLRDVLFLSHARPKDEDQASNWRKLVNRSLESPDTWEVALSKGVAKTPEEKRAHWTRLLAEDKLGAMALLRNLRNMMECGVDASLIEKALQAAQTGRVLPFRFLSAAKAVPQLEPALEPLMLRCLEGRRHLSGHTVLLVDHSASMVGCPISRRSDLDRFEAACGLAILAREQCESVRIICFSNRAWEVPPRRGFSLRDALRNGGFGGTYLGSAVEASVRQVNPDRLIVFTDEQSSDRVPSLIGGRPKGYMVNVASYRNGLGYGNGWTNITGFSEGVLDYIAESEKT